MRCFVKMGGGTSYRASFFGKKRKAQISLTALRRTGRDFDIDLDLTDENQPFDIKVVNKKNWKNPGAAAFYSSNTNTITVQREFFAGIENQNVMTHEILHSFSGPHEYRGIGAIMEEGTVEYLGKYTRDNSFRGRGTKFSGGYRVYNDEVSIVGKLSNAVGQKQYFKLWKEGFSNNHTVLANNLHSKGYKNTSELIRNSYDSPFLFTSSSHALEVFERALKNDEKRLNK